MLGFDRWQLLKTLSAILTIAGLAWLALTYLIPAPPSKITIATSQAGDHYQVLGTRYQGILAGSDIEVELRLTDGAKENLRLLNDASSGIQIGFMQGGVSHGKLAPDLLSLGRIDYQIFWLFYPTGETLTDLTQLKGKRIAMGPADSGDRAVCEKILAAAGINYDNTTLLYFAPKDAAKALDDGAVDAVFLNLSPDSPILDVAAARPAIPPDELHRVGGAHPDFPLSRSPGAAARRDRSRAHHSSRRHPSGLDHQRRPGAKGNPSRDHRSAVTGHSGSPWRAGAVSEDRRFSDANRSGISVRAKRARFLQERPVIHEPVPAVLDDQLCAENHRGAGGGVAIVLPVFNYAPKLYLWFVRQRVRRLYRRLRLVDKALLAEPTAIQVQTLQSELENITRAATIVPMRNSELFFDLRNHIDRTRTNLTAR